MKNEEMALLFSEATPYIQKYQVFTSSNKPERLDIMPAVRMPLIQSAMALRTVSIQSPSLAEMVDKGLEQVQEKNNVGQKLHNSTAFH